MCQPVLLGMHASFVEYHCRSGSIGAQVGEAPSCLAATQAQETGQSEYKQMQRQHIQNQHILKHQMHRRHMQKQQVHKRHVHKQHMHNQLALLA